MRRKHAPGEYAAKLMHRLIGFPTTRFLAPATRINVVTCVPHGWHAAVTPKPAGEARYRSEVTRTFNLASMTHSAPLEATAG